MMNSVGCCSTPGCDRSVYVKKRALCQSCYNRLRRSGDFRPWSEEERFNFRVSEGPQVEGVDGPCWDWTGAISKPAGYGAFALAKKPGQEKNKMQGAHQWSYEHFVGPVPQGLELDHLCRRRNCVNPDHLEPVTHQENVLRGASPAAVNAAKSQCPKGHWLSGVNLYVYPDGRRQCVVCARESSRAWKERQKKSGVSG